MLIDLHTHSNMSDGSLPPSDLIELAIQSNISVLALTDHDTMDGLPAARQAVERAKDKGHSITLVPGVEISVYYNNIDIHLLGLLVDDSCQTLKEALADANGKRIARNEKMAAAFRKDGIPITLELLQERAKADNSVNDTNAQEDTVITRAHFASYLIELGLAKSTPDAFNKYLGEDGPYYISREYLDPQKGIELIHSAKGLAFIAHPFLYDFTLEEVSTMISDFKYMGLDGIEVIHSRHSKEQEEILRKLADDNDLLITGGSDFHGDVKPDIKLGVGTGNLNIPYSVYEDIKKEQAAMF